MSRFKNRLLQTPFIFYTGLGRLKTGSDRFGQAWLWFSHKFGTGLNRFTKPNAAKAVSVTACAGVMSVST